jgi:uncharacterized protein (TIGR02996 family)
VLATTHPDATAFAARFLAHPDDRLGRLVFADWLDEQGGESNTAWADYIRTRAEIEQLRWNDPAWDELTERATESGRRVRAYLRMAVRSPRLIARLPSLIPPHRCDLDILRFYPPAAEAWQLPESLAREHQVVPLHFDNTCGYLACPMPDDWELVSKLVLLLNRNLYVFGTDSATASHRINRAYPVASPTVREPVWPLPVYDPTADVTELETLLNQSIEAGVSVLNLVVTHGEWRHVRVVCFFRSQRRQREPMALLTFRRVVAAVMRRTADQLPRTGPPVDFTHQHDGQTYLISALAPTDGLTLWLRPRRDPRDLLR